MTGLQMVSRFQFVLTYRTIPKTKDFIRLPYSIRETSAQLAAPPLFLESNEVFAPAPANRVASAVKMAVTWPFAGPFL